MPKSVPSVPRGDGNIDPPCAKANPQYKYDFVINNFSEEELTNAIDSIKKICKKAVLGKEVGECSSVPHIQGYISLKKKERITSLVKYPGLERASFRKCRNEDALIQYCQKDNNIAFMMGIDIIEPIYDAMEELPFKPWQNQIIEIIKGSARNRDIWWFWEATGGVGKTKFAIHLKLKYDAMYLSGKAADMKYSIAQRKIPPKIIIMDFPKSSQDYISYSGIEEIKNGIFFAGKLKSVEYIMNQPHVICFANKPPEGDEVMSADKFNAVNIGEKSENKNYDF